MTGGPAGESPGASTARLDRLNAAALALAGDRRLAARLLVLRLVQRRPEDAAARDEAEGATAGGWGRVERRARLALGERAASTQVAAWIARELGLDRG